MGGSQLNSPNLKTAVSDARTSLRVFAAAVNTAASLTVAYAFPDVPNEILIAWGGVFMAGVGFGEAIFDSVRK